MKNDVPNILSVVFHTDEFIDKISNDRCFLYSVKTFDHWERHGMQNWWEHPKYQLKNNPYSNNSVNIK